MKKKLHILFLSGSYPSRICLFNGDHVQKHAEAVTTKHQVTAIHVISDKNLKKSIEFTESIINNVKTIIYYIPITKFKFYYFLKAYKASFKNIDAFDMVHLNVTYPKGLIALYLKWLKKKKYIISEHWTGYQYPRNKSIGFIEKLLTKLIIKNASFICPVSENLQNEMITFGLKGNYIPVPNVVDTTTFFPIKKEISLYTIVHISSLKNVQKNITGILNAIKLLSNERTDFVFKIIGNGDPQQVQHIINKLQIPKKNIQLKGEKSPQEIARILQESNLYISFSNYETFGIVMTESIACGTPVISTNTGILTELNASEFSTIIPINDQILLLQTILKYMNSNKIYNTKKMHHLIESNFSINSICNKFSELYFKTLNN